MTVMASCTLHSSQLYSQNLSAGSLSHSRPPLSLSLRKDGLSSIIVWQTLLSLSNPHHVPLWVSSLNCIKFSSLKRSAKADESVAPALIEDTPTKFLLPSHKILAKSAFNLHFELIWNSHAPGLMPGWPLWCGVGLAKSSFMEEGAVN